MSHPRRWFAPLVAVLALTSPAAGQVMFTVIDVGPSGAMVATTFGINNANQVVGQYAVFNGSTLTGSSFRWDPAAGRADLSSAGPLTVDAHAINDLGQIAGYGRVSSPAVNDHVYRTTPNGLVFGPTTDLGAFPGFTQAQAYGINVRGQVTGLSRAAGQVGSSIGEFAFRTSPTGGLTDPAANLGALDGRYSVGYGINASGQVVGESTVANSQFNHAFRTSPKGRVSDPGAVW